MEKNFHWIGDPISIGNENHYDSFEFFGTTYFIGDTVYMNSQSTNNSLKGDIYNSWIGEIDSTWECQGKQYFECRWYYGNYDLPETVRPEYKCRELYETNHVNDNLITSILRKVNVVSYEQYEASMKKYELLKKNDELEEKQRDYYEELFWCNKFFDIHLKLFRLLPKETYDIKSKRVFLYSHHRSMKQNITTESAIITDSIREKTEETIKRYYDQQDANNENKRICQDSSEEEKPIDYGLRLLSDINTKKPPLSPLQIAINNLQLSSTPDHISCRDQEKKDIHDYIATSITNNGNPASLYISGMPGTGKTATVREVLRELQNEVYQQKLKKFNLVDINGMKLVNPSQVFSVICKSLLHVSAVPNKAVQVLNDLFTNGNDIAMSSLMVSNESKDEEQLMNNDLIVENSPSTPLSESKEQEEMTPKDDIVPTVILIDELDYICNQSQNILYQLFDWPTHPESHLIVIVCIPLYNASLQGIANTMDLPERILTQRNRSRLSLTRYNFKPYTRDQISTILKERLSSFLDYNSEAIELCSRKVAAISGDIRRGLTLIRRALEIVIEKGQSKLTIQDVVEAANEHTDDYKLQLIGASNIYIKLSLIAISHFFNVSSTETITIQQLYNNLSTLCKDQTIKMISYPEFLYILRDMEANELIVIDKKTYKTNTSIRLLFQLDDLGYALANEKDLLKLIQ